MTTPFPFTAGQTLTAAQMNAITELPLNEKAASHTLTAADAGDYVVMNSASATTITVNTSVFTTGQVVYIVNKGTANTVITAGAGVTITSSGSLTVPANGSGRLLALSASAFIYEAGGITASAGALTLVTASAFTSASTITLAANTFSSTFRNYRFILNTTASGSSTAATMVMRAGSTNTTSGYRFAQSGLTSTGTTSNTSSNSASSWQIIETNTDPSPSVMSVDIINPQIASHTLITGTFAHSNGSFGLIVNVFGGRLGDTTQYDAAVITFAAAMTGVFRIYGYADS
jgi:hypothetical protein